MALEQSTVQALARSQGAGSPPPVSMRLMANGARGAGVISPAAPVPPVRAADLGLNRLSLSLIAIQVLCLLGTAVAYPLFGLRLEVTQGQWEFLILKLGIAAIVWGYFFAVPGRSNEWITAEAAFGFMLVLSAAAIMAPAQYAAVAAQRPLVDPILAAADSSLGIHVPSLHAWVVANPLVERLMLWSYNSFVVQLFFIFPLLWLINDRRAVWEYAFHYHVCLIITVLVSALWPAASVFQYYAFEPSYDFTRFIAHFNGIRDGTMTVVPMADMDGLVSIPSFHAAAGLFLTWAVRRRLWLLIPLGALNALLIASTVMVGAHYFVDIVAALLLFCVSATVYPHLERRHLAGIVAATSRSKW